MIKSLGASNYSVASQISKNSNEKSVVSNGVKSPRQERIEEITKQIADGSYKVDLEKTANAILREIV